MDNIKETWQNTQTKNPKPSKTYGLNSSTAISHLAVHDVRRNDHGFHEPPQIFITVATYDCEFVLLQNQFASGKMTSDPEFKEILKFKTNYPIMQCQLQYHLNTVQYNYLIGYLIDMYSNIYTVNFTRNMELSSKYTVHPVQFTTVYRNLFSICLDELYLETPLLLKKISDGIISVSLKGEIQFIDVNQSKSWISSYDHLNAHALQLGHRALAAAHNASKCRYDSVVVVAAHNMRVPYVFVNCSSLSDFQTQKAFQDKYEWMEDSVEVTYCSLDPRTSAVAVSTVAQNIEIFEIASVNNNFYLKKKFGFFMGANPHLGDLGISIDLNIESVHANRGMLMVVSCKEYLIFDIQNRAIRKRGKGVAISMLRHGGVIDRNESLISILIVKGYNHINQPQSKLGKPNLHFKTIDYKKDKS